MQDHDDSLFDDQAAVGSEVEEPTTDELPGEPVSEPQPEPAAESQAIAEPEPPAAVAATPPANAPDAALVEGVGGGLTWIPYAIYLGLWVVLAALSAYLLWDATPEQPARWMPEYVPLLWTGVALTALGPVLSVAVWVFARSGRPKMARRGLFASAMTRGAVVAFFGVVLWLGTLFVLDLMATGWAL